jgi:hypothetical protein
MARPNPKEVSVRKFVILIAAFVTLSFCASNVLATDMTEQQVIDKCGNDLQKGSTSGAKASGCDKPCGDKTCTYNCCKGKNCGEEGCHGYVVGRLTGGRKINLRIPTSVMKEIRQEKRPH